MNTPCWMRVSLSSFHCFFRTNSTNIHHLIISLPLTLTTLQQPLISPCLISHTTRHNYAPLRVISNRSQVRITIPSSQGSPFDHKCSIFICVGHACVTSTSRFRFGQVSSCSLWPLKQSPSVFCFKFYTPPQESIYSYLMSMGCKL